MSDVPLIIVNPRSGRGLTEQKWAGITVRIRRHLGAFDTAFTQRVGDGIRISEEEARKGRRWLIAMGGDGTISEVVTGILQAGTGADFSILPRGTGGDLRRSLSLPNDVEKVAEILARATPHPIDIGRIRYVDHQGNNAERYFVNSASFGVSGKVADRVNRSSKMLGGTIAFATATLKTAFTYDNREVAVSVDGGPVVRMKILTICAANGRYTGGGMNMAPDASLNDGLFDIVFIGDFKAPEVLFKSYRLYSGTHLELDKVRHVRGASIHAEPGRKDQQVLLEVDGETPGRLPATIDMLPRALNIRY